MLGGASGAVAGPGRGDPGGGRQRAGGRDAVGRGGEPGLLRLRGSLKNRLRLDDSLDVFGIHGLGGIVGSIGTALVALPALGGHGGADYALGHQLHRADGRGGGGDRLVGGGIGGVLRGRPAGDAAALRPRARARRASTSATTASARTIISGGSTRRRSAGGRARRRRCQRRPRCRTGAWAARPRRAPRQPSPADSAAGVGIALGPDSQPSR